MSGQAVIMMVGALLLVLSTIRLVRMRLLSIRYGIAWLIVGIGGAIGAPILTIVANGIHVFGFTPTGFSLGIFVSFLGLVCLQLSISLSGLHHVVQDLAEHSAHLEARIRFVEGDRSAVGERPTREPRHAGRAGDAGTRVPAAPKTDGTTRGVSA